MLLFMLIRNQLKLSLWNQGEDGVGIYLSPLWAGARCQLNNLVDHVC